MGAISLSVFCFHWKRMRLPSCARPPTASRIIFQWKQNTDREIAPMDTYTVNRDGRGLRKLSDEEVRNFRPSRATPPEERRLRVYSNSGDLYTLNNTTGKITQLTKTSEAETNPRFTQDGKRIFSLAAATSIVMALDGGILEQLTDIRSAAAPTTAPAAGGGGARLGGGGGGGRGAAAAARSSGDSTPPNRAAPIARNTSRRNRRNFCRWSASTTELREEQQKKRIQDTRANLSPCRPARTASALQLKSSVIATHLRSCRHARQEHHRPQLHLRQRSRRHQRALQCSDSQGTSRLAIINVETGGVKWVDHGQKKPGGTRGRDVP